VHVGKNNWEAKEQFQDIFQCEFIHNKEEINFADLAFDELISPGLGPTEIQTILNQSAFNNTYELEGP